MSLLAILDMEVRRIGLWEAAQKEAWLQAQGADPATHTLMEFRDLPVPAPWFAVKYLALAPNEDVGLPCTWQEAGERGYPRMILRISLDRQEVERTVG
jgi:hypothetical protein